MDDATGLDRLFSAGVFSSDDGAVQLSASFERAVEDHRSALAGSSRDDVADLVRERIDDATVDPVVDLWERDPRSLAELLGLLDHLGPGSADAAMKRLPVLRLFRDDVGPMEGVPEPFVPVAADLIQPLAKLYARVLVYVWLDDCEPCDALKERLESILERPDGIVPVAVYGPDDREFLARRYDVTAGPALLFVRDGSVDSRLYGDQEERVLRAELDRLRA